MMRKRIKIQIRMKRKRIKEEVAKWPKEVSGTRLSGKG